jgi:hypothetical protein
LKTLRIFAKAGDTVEFGASIDLQTGGYIQLTNSVANFWELTAVGINPKALPVAVNDAAAAAAGVPQWGYYRNGSVVMTRVV